MKSKKISGQVRVTGVRFDHEMIHVALNDGREIGVSLKVKWLRWLARASSQQRDKWAIDPWGDAIYWDELDDGFELCHLLDMRPLAC